MERLKLIKEKLVDMVMTELSYPEHANTRELGEVIDMIKDVSKAMYNCTIVKAIESKEE